MCTRVTDSRSGKGQSAFTSQNLDLLGKGALYIFSPAIYPYKFNCMRIKVKSYILLSKPKYKIKCWGVDSIAYDQTSIYTMQSALACGLTETPRPLSTNQSRLFSTSVKHLQCGTLNYIIKERNDHFHQVGKSQVKCQLCRC